MDYNKVLLMGRLTRDPVLRYLNSGTPVCELGLAVNRRFRRSDGEQGEETCFVDVVVWNRQAENCNQYLKKGAGIFLEGRLQLDTWEGQDGQKRSKHRVVAERVQFLPRSGGGGGGGFESEVSDFGESYGADSAPSSGEAVKEYDPEVPF